MKRQKRNAMDSSFVSAVALSLPIEASLVLQDETRISSYLLKNVVYSTMLANTSRFTVYFGQNNREYFCFYLFFSLTQETAVLFAFHADLCKL